MTRIINVENVGNKRNQLIKAIVAAIRELVRQNETEVEAHDLVSFIIFSLETIAKSIEISVVAWEKRGYWVKADRFRMEWDWTGKIAASLRTALEEEDWKTIAGLTVTIGQKLSKTKIADKNRIGTPWKGCWMKISHNMCKK